MFMGRGGECMGRGDECMLRGDECMGMYMGDECLGCIRVRVAPPARQLNGENLSFVDPNNARVPLCL